MDDREELVALRRLAELEAKTGPAGARQPISAPNDTGELESARLQGVTGAELIAGSAPGRFVLGAASPFIGAAQLAGNALGVGDSE